MARTASGSEFLEQAKACLAKAQTVNELRQAQAVVLPLELGISMEQTAQLLGVSEGWACQLRTRFIRNGGQWDEAGPGRGGRRRENLSREEEAAFLAPFLEQAKAGGILVVSEIKQALDARLGRVTALASTYNLLHRHGWRKLAPDKRHPKSDPAAQADWKKNSPKSSPKSTGSGRAKGRSA
jgi:transposase